MLPYYIIAVLVGMALLNTFLFVILKKLSDRTGRLIRSSVLKELSVYDHVLGRKLNEALAFNAELGERKERAASVVPQQEGPSAPQQRLDTVTLLSVQGGAYRNETFLRDYRRVKQLSRQDVPAVIEEIRRRGAADPTLASGRLAASILEKIPPSAVYELITLPEQEQLQIIRELFNDAERALLERHLALSDAFDLTSFLDQMEGEAHAGTDQMVIYVSDPNADYSALGSNIQTVFDPSICEGVRVLYRNKLYDYCLLRREVM